MQLLCFFALSQWNRFGDQMNLCVRVYAHFLHARVSYRNLLAKIHVSDNINMIGISCVCACACVCLSFVDIHFTSVAWFYWEWTKAKLTFVSFFFEMVKRLFVRTFLEHTIAHTKRAMPMPRFISFAFAVENAINLCEKRGGPLLELGTPKFEEIECDQNDLQNTQIMICRCVCGVGTKYISHSTIKNIWNGIFFLSTFRFGNPWCMLFFRFLLIDRIQHFLHSNADRVIATCDGVCWMWWCIKKIAKVKWIGKRFNCTIEWMCVFCFPFKSSKPMTL